MVDLTKVLKPFLSKGRIQQHHFAGDKFAAVVFDEKTKAELTEALEPLKLNVFVTLAAAPVTLNAVKLSTDDSIEIVYTGTLSIDAMKLTGFGKKVNHQFSQRFLQLFETNRIFEPIVLSQDLTVIDGEQRINALIELNTLDPSRAISKLPVIVLNTTPLQAKFLRLVLNKSNEFQRWHWDAVDTFLEEHPELLPQLEPLGIFGERVLPESYFGNTVTTYEIYSDDETMDKTQQSFYKQEHGLARWAELKRAAEQRQNDKRKTAKKIESLSKMDSIFDTISETD